MQMQTHRKHHRHAMSRRSHILSQFRITCDRGDLPEADADAEERERYRGGTGGDYVAFNAELQPYPISTRLLWPFITKTPRGR